MLGHQTVDKMVDTGQNSFTGLYVLFWDIHFYNLPDSLA